MTGQQVGLGMGFSRKVGWSRLIFPRILRVTLVSSPSAHRLGEFFKLDLKEPFLGSLMIHEGGTITLLCIPRSQCSLALRASKQWSWLWYDTLHHEQFTLTLE